MAKASSYIECPIDFSPDVERTGAYANAFRIIPDAGVDYFIDFCVYSQEEECAKVVARVRVHHAFLNIMQERLALDLLSLQGLTTPFCAEG